MVRLFFTYWRIVSAPILALDVEPLVPRHVWTCALKLLPARLTAVVVWTGQVVLCLLDLAALAELELASKAFNRHDERFIAHAAPVALRIRDLVVRLSFLLEEQERVSEGDQLSDLQIFC